MSLKISPVCEASLSREQVFERVKQIVAEFAAVPPNEIRETHLLLEELGLDSLDLVECSMEVEEEFGISVPDEMVEQVKTVGDIADGVMALLIQPHSDAAGQPLPEQ
jgi:acyl carrier protein